MQHLRYPPDLFEVQRQILAQYHVTQAQSFYGGQNFWAVPADPGSSQQFSQPPYYQTMAMPGSSRDVLADHLAGPAGPREHGGLPGRGQRPAVTGLRHHPGPAVAAEHHDPGAAAGAEQLRAGSQRLRPAGPVPAARLHGDQRQPDHAAGGRHAALRGTRVHPGHRQLRRDGQRLLPRGQADPGLAQRAGRHRPDAAAGAQPGAHRVPAAVRVRAAAGPAAAPAAP